MDSKIMLEVKDLSVTFPVKKASIFERRNYLSAVSGVSLEIYKGETFGLVGESGCGKSTLANVTLGLQAPSSGKVLFDGEDISDKNRRKAAQRRMQKIFQDPASSLNPRFTVKDAISEPLRIRGGYSDEEMKEITIDMIRAVGLSENDLNRYTSEFSGGQQQRIAIARALILKPEYIVCDEPVSSLDVSVHAQILNLLMELQQKTGVTYLFISHNLAVVKKLCSRLAIMYLGKVVEYGDAKKIFERPMHPYTKALLSAVLSVKDAKGNKRVVLKGDVADPIHPPKGCRFHTRCPQATEACKTTECELTQVEDNHFMACPFAYEQKNITEG